MNHAVLLIYRTINFITHFRYLFIAELYMSKKPNHYATYVYD